MQDILNPTFWFDLTPVRMSPVFEVGFFILFALMVITGLALRIIKKGKKDKFDRIALEKAVTLALTVGILGFVWLFMTFEEIQIFGARFWVLVLTMLGVFMGVQLYRYHRIQVPQLRLQEQSKAEANKYLPRRRS